MNSMMFDNAVDRIVERDSRFDHKAYEFLREALDFTLARMMKENDGMRHVSGRELLEGFRDFALLQFGPLSATVMREWGLKNGYHVGEMVYALISEGVFSQQDGDSLNDFKGFTPFKEAFERPYEPAERDNG